MHYRPKHQTLTCAIRNAFLITGWLLIWFFPWQENLNNLWLKIGISLAVFIIPGANLYYLLNDRKFSRLQLIPFGFILSQLLLAVLGTVGRFLQIPFTYVKEIFMLIGFILIITNLINNIPPHQQIRTIDIKLFLSFWPLFIITVLAALSAIQRVISSDDLAYLAHITNWQQMPELNFNDVYFYVDKIESTRFWVVSSIFSQAFLVELSGVPGLILLSGYYEPFLVFISIASLYLLAKSLHFSHQSALIATILQIVFLAFLSDYLHPGAPFFHQLSSDKATAAFIGAPVFFSSSIQLLDRFNKRNLSTFILLGLSLCFLHPIISAFAVFIVCTMVIIRTSKNNLRQNMIIMALAVISLTPQIGVRLVRHEAQAVIPNNIDDFTDMRGLDNLILRLDETPFYGFNPKILEMRIPYIQRLPFSTTLFGWLWLVIPLIAAILAYKGMRNNSLKQYILSTTLLVAFAGIPFTGWILGYFVSAWVLERTTWLYPFGISSMFILLSFKDQTRLGRYLSTKTISIQKNIYVKVSWLVKLSIITGATLAFILFMREQDLPNMTRLQNSTNRYQELIQIGRHLDHNLSKPTNIIGSDELNDYIPLLSWKAKVITYRPEDLGYPYFFTTTERNQNLKDRQALLSSEVLPEVKMGIINKHQIRFFLIEKYKLGKVSDLISTYPDSFHVYIFGRYCLIAIE